MPVQAQWGGGGTAPTRSQSRHWKGWVVSITPRQLYPRKRDPVPVVQEAGWASGPVWTGTENFASTRIRSPDCPAGLGYRGIYTVLSLKYTQQLLEMENW